VLAAAPLRVAVAARRDQRGDHLAVVLDEGDVALAGRRDRDPNDAPGCAGSAEMACDEDRCRILGKPVRGGRSPVV
jgi:hypothetical protein